MYRDIRVLPPPPAPHPKQIKDIKLKVSFVVAPFFVSWQDRCGKKPPALRTRLVSYIYSILGG